MRLPLPPSRDASFQTHSRYADQVATKIANELERLETRGMVIDVYWPFNDHENDPPVESMGIHGYMCLGCSKSHLAAAVLDKEGGFVETWDLEER